MDNRAFFWKAFGSERVNSSQKLLESAEKYFYPTFSAFWSQLSFAIFVLLFLYLHEISNVLKKNMKLIGQVFLKLLTPKDVVI